jgi:diacylglycerol O-acyltransferase / wax synthase
MDPVIPGRWMSRWLGTPLDPEDAARLWMDTPANPMIVTALLRLDGPLDFVTFTDLAEARALTRERLRARVGSLSPLLPFARPRWRDDRHPSIARHVEHVRLPPGSGDEALARAVSRIASEPLDPARPLWRMWLIDEGDGRAAVAVRIHHVIADGVALLGVLYGFSDEGAGVVMPSRQAPAAVPGAAAAHRLAGLARIARLAARRSDTPAALAGRPRGEKAFAWSTAFDVLALRDAAHHVGAHVNDVVLGALAGALRVLVARGDAPPPRDAVHALVPVALPHHAGALENRYASMFVRLPIDVADPRGRVVAARVSMNEARAQAGVEVGRSLVTAAFALGAHIEHIGVRLLSHKASLVASNVAGPSEPMHVGGRQIRSIAFASPTCGSIALSASAFSYAGELRVTIATDTAVMPDAWPFVRLFEEEMRSTLAALLGAAKGSA